MANSYIPRAQQGALQWMLNFAKHISNNPWQFGLSPADAATIQQAVDACDEAMRVALNVNTRTLVTVAEKDRCRAIAEATCQAYYAQIKVNLGVTNAAKSAIGVRPVNRSRTPINVPASSPCLYILSATNLQQHLRYCDSMNPTRRAKPFGATSLELRVRIADDALRDPNEARMVGLFTTNWMTITFKTADAGKKATYFGRWVSRKGETGPWSLPVSMSVAA